MRRLAIAGGLLAVALFTRSRQLPGQVKPGSGFLITPDWKAWARVLLGVGAVQKINQAFDWHPPPWLNAVETVAVLHPLMAGFSKRYPLEVGIMAPLIAGIVSLNNWLSPKVEPVLEEQAGIPKLLTRIATSLGFTVAGIALFPKVINQVAKTGLLGKIAQETAKEGKNVMFGAIAIGANCGCGNVICVTQMGELFGSLFNNVVHWRKSSPPESHNRFERR